ncbi:MAG TPA: HlyD family secretion protein [Cyanobacteria bacterium UBA11991]|nr:HlyD family secretion protein [Cyanobacteriota bacterium]MDY6358812.1 HlyD family secretion protein [Cyanobacteriota bacterium]MDY6364135.1 HlyD family secretion protein [Cyanobacteriota bacterium]MDY6383390.1 HlyD family secretion protein [Cyanobacteriota bacterium]HCB11245.1 HlyD family secretion protein [Cyanobacteria bacterium UBA11991]
MKDTRHFYQKKRVITLMILLPIIILLGAYVSIRSIFYKTTDDAYVEGHIVTIAPRVSGPVIKLFIDDNVKVKKGDLLLEIDPNDYAAKLRQSEANLEEARAQLVNAQNQVKKTYSELDFAKDDYNRYSQSYQKGISSTQDYDSAKTKLTTTDSENKSAKAKSDELKATIKRLEAEVEENKLNLSYTRIYAPQDGKITNRTVELGNYVQVAQPLFSIAKDNVWVVANYKETQVANMKKGQKVKIKVDAYGRKVFNGKIDSIQMASGAKASLFPPENAVGSYVKIVQRIPVKILFTDDISKYNIVPGMSVVPTVKVK